MVPLPFNLLGGGRPSSSATTAAKANKMLPPSSNGRLVATILAAYDLPDDAPPSTVSMRLEKKRNAKKGTAAAEAPAGGGGDGNEEDEVVVGTGPPAARHRDHKNAFKFGRSGSNANASEGGGGSSDGGTSGSNVLVLSAPLSSLYTSTAVFRVAYGGSGASTTKSLEARCVLCDALRVNETEWLILHLSSGEDAGGTSTKDNPNAAATVSSDSVASGAEPPTLRLKLRLEGPQRPEVAALVGVAQSWFRAVDSVQTAAASATSGVVETLPRKLPAARYLLVPAVPIAASVVALAPVFVGVLVVGLPFFLPLLVVLVAFASALLAIGAFLYGSTKSGRDGIGHAVAPLYETFLRTPAGQKTVYDVGPRPTPISFAHAVLPDDMMGKLIVSLVIDLIGSSSYLLPVVGEAFDLAWAPTQMVLVAAMYDKTSPNLKYVSLVEELLPFTDLFPSATAGWVREFGPEFWEEGRKRLADTAVVVRGEREALRSGSRS